MLIKHGGKDYITSKKCMETIRKGCRKNQADMPEGWKAMQCTECGEPYKKYYASKLNLCCACTGVRREIQIKKGGVLKLHDGYPKDTAFTSIKELNAYYADEQIECLLCGNEFNALNHHLRTKHEMTVDDYRLKFGLPFSRGLNGTYTHELLAENGHRMIELGGGAEVMAARMMSGERKPSRQCYHAPALQKKQRRAIRAAGLSKNHISKRKKMVSAFCADCGDILENKVAEHTLLTQKCRLLCGKCKAVHAIDNQQRWADKKGIDLKEYKRKNSKRYNAENRERVKKRSLEYYHRTKKLKGQTND